MQKNRTHLPLSRFNQKIPLLFPGELPIIRKPVIWLFVIMNQIEVNILNNLSYAILRYTISIRDRFELGLYISPQVYRQLLNSILTLRMTGGLI